VRKIELLDKSHDREGFDCGSEPLNLFLRQTARQHAVRGISRTFVMVEEEDSDSKQIIGFFSLNLCQVKSEMLPLGQGGKLPRDVSGIRLGRLAVASSRQRQGIGQTLVMGAMQKCLEIFYIGGGIGLFVDAKDHEAKRYYENFGFVLLPSKELELFLPLKTIQDVLAL
jgi:GNAT superfamily N-acetyltransferase